MADNSLPILDKHEIQMRLARAAGTCQTSGATPGSQSGKGVNRRDFTKARAARSVSNPCAMDYNMRSCGASNNVRIQQMPNGAIIGYIDTPAPPPREQGRPATAIGALMVDDRSPTPDEHQYGSSSALLRPQTAPIRAHSAPLRPRTSKSASRKINPPFKGSPLDREIVELLKTPGAAERREPTQLTVSEPAVAGEREELKLLVKEAVNEYFSSLAAQQADPVSARQQPMSERQAWVVVPKGNEWSRPASTRSSSRQNKLWSQSVDPERLSRVLSEAPLYEKTIVKNLLTKLNGGQTPVELQSRPGSGVRDSQRRRSMAEQKKKWVEPAVYQCDVSTFRPLPAVPQRHFTINPEWTSERLTVRKVSASHLHPSATFKNKLGLLSG